VTRTLSRSKSRCTTNLSSGTTPCDHVTFGPTPPDGSARTIRTDSRKRIGGSYARAISSTLRADETIDAVSLRVKDDRINPPSGPLRGLRMIELAGIGPGPFCGMVLADMGADVVRIDRAPAVWGDASAPSMALWDRGRRSVAVDLKHPDGVGAVLRLVDQADALIEGFRPGVTERLGLGPDECLRRNPRLVYGRVTGWGQQGPYASAAGHDINYIALAGALDPIGRCGEAPVPPLNLVGDFGGGGMLLAMGICAAVVDVGRSGLGQVVDAAMVDGAALLTTMFHSFRALGTWNDQRGTNTLDTGAHFYEVYETSDHKYVSVGSLEPQFYAELLKRTGLADDPDFAVQMDTTRWPDLKKKLATVFRTKTRNEWCELMEHSDVCFAPVLSLAEAPQHPHNVARGTFIEIAGAVQPAVAPRFSRTPGVVQRPPAAAGRHTDEVLIDWGFTPDEVAGLRKAGAVK
jgi:alpha-methylacyl-CoA racemase